MIYELLLTHTTGYNLYWWDNEVYYFLEAGSMIEAEFKLQSWCNNLKYFNRGTSLLKSYQIFHNDEKVLVAIAKGATSCPPYPVISKNDFYILKSSDFITGTNTYEIL